MEQKLFGNICRICLSEEEEFQSVFVSDEASGVPINISEMIMACTSIQITIGDGLPEQICKNCAEKAVKLFLFKVKCEQSDATLRSQLEKSLIELEIAPSSQVIELKHTTSVSNDIVKSEPIIEPPNSMEESMEISCSEVEETISIEPDNVNEKIDSFEVNSLDDASDHVPVENVVDKDESTQEQKPTKEFECETCGKHFSRQDLLVRHKIAHAMKLNDPNEMVTSFPEGLQHGVFIKTETNFYQCRKCDFIFVSESDLRTHIVTVHQNKAKGTPKGTSECKICKKTFTKISRHMKTHAEYKPYVCQICNKSFIRQEQLTNHLNGHSGVKPHVCKICFKGFNQISNLKDHLRTHNGEKPFLCSTCGKGFNQLGNLRQHTVRHSGIKAHLCSTCGSGFASKGELSAHLRKHTGARPFVCETCNHGFTTSSSLTKHKRIHSGERPYECDVCKMKFSRSGILARHKRTHTGEKPYVCQFCSKAFSQSNDLTSHLRIHTGEKPYICDECGQAFRQSSALKTHKKVHGDRSEAKHKALATATLLGLGRVPVTTTIQPLKL